MDPYSRVAYETLVTTGLDFTGIVRDTIREIGYDAACGFDGARGA